MARDSVLRLRGAIADLLPLSVCHKYNKLCYAHKFFYIFLGFHSKTDDTPGP